MDGRQKDDGDRTSNPGERRRAPKPQFARSAGAAGPVDRRNAPSRLVAWLRVVVPVAILGGAVAAAAWLVATRPAVERKPVPERAWTISAVAVTLADIQPDLRLLGEVVAGRSVELRPLVGGRVIEVGDNYVEGGIVRAGELLVAIDPFDYESSVAEREAQLIEARARLDELEAELVGERALLEQDLEQLTLAKRELERRANLRRRGSGSQKSLDDAQVNVAETQQRVIARNQGIDRLAARIAQQQAVISQRKVAVDRAVRDLGHARLVAPFDAFLTDRGTAIGKQVSVNDRVARLIDASWLEARFQVSDAEFARLIESGGVKGRAAKVVWRTRTRDFEFDATIERTGSEVDTASGGVELFARIHDIGLNTVLRPGVFVEVRIPDRSYRRVARLPAPALQGEDLVYVAVDGRLQPRRVELVARAGNDVLVRGELADGDQVAASTFPEIGPGVKVELR